MQMKKNKWKYMYVLKRIWLVVVVMFVGAGFYRGWVYSSFYEDEIDMVIKQPDKNFFMWNTLEVVENRENCTNTYFFLLSGTSTIRTIENEMSSIDINSSVKTGKVKVLLLNEKDEVVLFKEVGNENINLELDVGEYKIILVGKWFIGNVAFKTTGTMTFQEP